MKLVGVSRIQHFGLSVFSLFDALSAISDVDSASRPFTLLMMLPLFCSRRWLIDVSTYFAMVWVKTSRADRGFSWLPDGAAIFFPSDCVYESVCVTVCVCGVGVCVGAVGGMTVCS